MVHVRSKGTAEFARVLGTEIEFGSDVDEIVFPTGSAELPLVDADKRLSKILLKVCEESLNARKSNVSALRIMVENTITPLLPHGTARADVVAEALGMSERTLARRLAEEGTTFVEFSRCSKPAWPVDILRKRTSPSPRLRGSSVSRRRALSLTHVNAGRAKHRSNFEWLNWRSPGGSPHLPPCIQETHRTGWSGPACQEKMAKSPDRPSFGTAENAGSTA